MDAEQRVAMKAFELERAKSGEPGFQPSDGLPTIHARPASATRSTHHLSASQGLHSISIAGLYAERSGDAAEAIGEVLGARWSIDLAFRRLRRDFSCGRGGGRKGEYGVSIMGQGRCLRPRIRSESTRQTSGHASSAWPRPEWKRSARRSLLLQNPRTRLLHQPVRVRLRKPNDFAGRALAERRRLSAWCDVVRPMDQVMRVDAAVERSGSKPLANCVQRPLAQF